jgi:hypothetical protein
MLHRGIAAVRPIMGTQSSTFMAERSRLWRRRKLILLGAVVAVGPLAARAQRPENETMGAGAQYYSKTR